MARGLYEINGNDVFASYGVIVTSFKNDLLALEERKEVFSRVWPDENGTEYYLEKFFYKDKPATLKGWIYGKDADEFKSKRAELWNAIAKSGEILIRALSLNTTYRAFYKRASSASTITSSSGAIGMQVDIEFQILGISNPNGAKVMVGNEALTVDGVEIYLK